MTEGEKWIKLLRAYGPVPEGHAQEAEKVAKLAARLGLPQLSFPHPAWEDLVECFPLDSGQFKVVVLTGTAGDGKTSLCYQLAELLTGSPFKRDDGSPSFQTFAVATGAGTRKLSMIYDVTGWRLREGSTLKPENVYLLEQAAAHAHGAGGHAFVLAVNDGQLHETIRALPPDCSSELKTMGEAVLELHANGEMEMARFPFLRLIDLSRISSDVFMQLCLDGIFNRPEWKCLEEEKDSPLFGEKSSIRINHALLSHPTIRQRLLTLARIADATGYHLPLRDILILLSNALLGHPEAPDKVIRPGAIANKLIGQSAPHKAALHLNLFGFNFSESDRNARYVFRFLSMLHAGEETTKDLDEIIIFGDRDEELKTQHTELVANDPFKQRNPALDSLILRYIRGEITDGKESADFLEELAHERRRIFLYASDEQVKRQRLWATTVFHHSGEYIEKILDPIRKGFRPAKAHIRRLAAGLNRVWTGLLLDDNAHEIYLAAGLDLSTSPVSDLLLKEIPITDDPPGFDIVSNGSFPRSVLRANGREFTFDLTLPRFEFLMRVASGAMPSSFSRESYEDFLSLKQCCLRDLCIRPNPEVLLRLDVAPNGQIHKEHIHLNECADED
jgi:hypothetical protein